MRAYVFTDEALGRHAGRFVWLSIDGEKAKNAPLRKRLALVAFPSFYAVDPTDERVALRWVGGFNAAQMPHILDAAEVAVRGARSPLDRMLVRADSLYAVGRDSAAADAYIAALAAAPADWPHRARSIESLVFALSQSNRHEEAAARAAGEFPRLGRTLSAANVAASGLASALELPAENPRRAGLVGLLEAATRDFVADTTVAMSPDDRSGLYIMLMGSREAHGDSVAHQRIAREWSAFLDASASRARTPEQRTVYDSHRLSAYIEIGHPEKAIPMLEQSERDFPDDYNPPARLSVAYRELKRWDEALAASDRALARAYGPRKLNIYRTRVDVLLGRGDREGAKRALTEAIATADALPAGQRSQASVDALKKRLESLN